MDSKIDIFQEKVNNIFNLMKDDWKEEEGVVTWNSWQWGAGDNPHEVSATNYHIFELLQENLNGEYNEILDLGCGYARVTPYFKQFSDNVYGYDYNWEMIEKARKAYPEIDFKSGKAQNLPYTGGKFDLVFCRSVLQHIEEEELRKVRSEINRVTGEGANLLIFEDVSSQGEGASDGHYNLRDKEYYEKFFSNFELVGGDKRRKLPFDRHDRKKLLIFEKKEENQ
mgnify:CR=1 FL=1